MQSQAENLQATLSFTEHNLSLAENNVIEKTKEIENLCNDLEKGQMELLKQKDETHKYMEKLQQQGSENMEKVQT